MDFCRHLLLALVCGVLTTPTLAADGKKKVVFIAGNPSHAYGAHEHKAGCDLLARSLKTAAPDVQVEVVHNGWPKDEKALDGASAIVMYCDGGGGHMVLAHKKEVDALARQGVGIVCLHYAVEVPKENGGPEFLDWIGGYFEANYSVNPTWTPKFDRFPEHPIMRGVKPFEIEDEWYYHMRFRPEMQGITPILTALPPANTLSRPDGPHSGNPDVRRDVLEKKEPQHVAWASENAGGGRGFGFTGGHFHWNWGEPNFRKLVLNAILWTAKVEVPKDGAGDKPVTLEDVDDVAGAVYCYWLSCVLLCASPRDPPARWWSARRMPIATGSIHAANGVSGRVQRLRLQPVLSAHRSRPETENVHGLSCLAPGRQQRLDGAFLMQGTNLVNFTCGHYVMSPS